MTEQNSPTPGQRLDSAIAKTKELTGHAAPRVKQASAKIGETSKKALSSAAGTWEAKTGKSKLWFYAILAVSSALLFIIVVSVLFSGGAAPTMANFQKVSQGMTVSQVRSYLGPESQSIPFSDSESSFTWRPKDKSQRFIQVRFKDDKAVEMFQREPDKYDLEKKAESNAAQTPKADTAISKAPTGYAAMDVDSLADAVNSKITDQSMAANVIWEDVYKLIRRGRKAEAAAQFPVLISNTDGECKEALIALAKHLPK